MQYLLTITLFALPLYAWPFSLFGVPTNGLMIWLGVLWLVFAVWLVRHTKVRDFVHSVSTISKRLLFCIALFFLAGFAAIFIDGVSLEKIGQFIVLFVQPIGTFFIARYILQRFPESKQQFVTGAYVFVFLTGVYAIVQYFTLIGVPAAWWGNHVEPKRSLSLFVHPNFYALFVTPLLAFLIPDTVSRIKYYVSKGDGGEPNHTTYYILLTTVSAWVIGGIGLLFSLSRGGWLGLAAALGFYFLLRGSRWVWWQGLIVLLAAVNIAWAVPSVRYRLTAPFQGEKSASSRLSLWETGIAMIQDNPIFGKGLLGFSNAYEAYSIDKTLEHHPTPHNIFIHAWIEVGLLGVLSFVCILAFAVIQSIKNKTNPYVLGMGLAIIAMLFHGLVDTPYFKNDLAPLFWILLAFI